LEIVICFRWSLQKNEFFKNSFCLEIFKKFQFFNQKLCFWERTVILKIALQFLESLLFEKEKNFQLF